MREGLSTGLGDKGRGSGLWGDILRTCCLRRLENFSQDSDISSVSLLPAEHSDYGNMLRNGTEIERYQPGSIGVDGQPPRTLSVAMIPPRRMSLSPISMVAGLPDSQAARRSAVALSEQASAGRTPTPSLRAIHLPEVPCRRRCPERHSPRTSHARTPGASKGWWCSGSLHGDARSSHVRR